jgi:hypothetical protein
MARRQKNAKRPTPKTVLRLPDLEQSKNAVLNSLNVRYFNAYELARSQQHWQPSGSAHRSRRIL